MTGSTTVPVLASELSALLVKTPRLAKYVGELGDASSNNLQAAAPLYQSLEMWGGMGSVADEAGVDLPPQQRRRVLELLIALSNEFEGAGIHYDRACQWVSTFSYWLDGGMIDREGRA